MSISPQGNAKRPRESKVGQFEVALFVDQEVLRLEVAVEDAVRVEVVDAADELVGLRSSDGEGKGEEVRVSEHRDLQKEAVE